MVATTAARRAESTFASRFSPPTSAAGSCPSRCRCCSSARRRTDNDHRDSGAYNLAATSGAPDGELRRRSRLLHDDCTRPTRGDPRLPTDSMTFKAGARRVLHKDARELPPRDRGRQRRRSRAAEAARAAMTRRMDVSLPPGLQGPRLRRPAEPRSAVPPAHRPAAQARVRQAPDAKSDALGALVAPQMSILGLSRAMGPVAGQDAGEPRRPRGDRPGARQGRRGQFDPADFFNGATILGGVKLADLVDGRGRTRRRRASRSCCLAR